MMEYEEKRCIVKEFAGQVLALPSITGVKTEILYRMEDAYIGRIEADIKDRKIIVLPAPSKADDWHIALSGSLVHFQVPGNRAMSAVHFCISLVESPGDVFAAYAFGERKSER
jgi:hypothetical protein